ncbi:prolyl oligopeptidase family serine peptidase [Herbiconiux moechotypicola]|uniref:Alpha/beta fold hydrolase n=1 Tax=Herbiconiux moechotypicola TaxID=637393 RepID=A0ABP5R3F1_9MICO|nr:prolyl oligopeptidase family serine peptidase [Herbiconiux moechotypicola]MCS5731843.1 prolyl oligopeptidase family serine peptidase [Herbiconiux moechotypicola]
MPHLPGHDAHRIAPFSPNEDDDFEIRTVLGHAVEGSSEPGEVLAAVAGIGKGDHEAWFTAWDRLGDRVAAIADAAAVAGHRASASGAYLRASTYYGVAVNAVSALPDSSALAPTFAKQKDAWEAFVNHAPVPVERVAIPLESDSMPGYLFRPAEPTGAALVAVNGSDGSLGGLWASCVAAGLRRGYTVLVFDGPGQQSQLFERGVPFRPDWENVLTPVYDFVAAQAGVDAARVGLYGISQGGYWVARALAYEHRFAAAVTDPGVVDVSTSWTAHLPHSLTKLLDAGDTEKFDKEMAFGLKLSPATARTWQFRARPYGSGGVALGYAETLEQVRRYTMADVADRITTPLFITDPEGEQFWPGQSARLAELTASVSTLQPFTAEEGAAGHCQPLARTLTAQRMYDWLDARLTTT